MSPVPLQMNKTKDSYQLEQFALAEKLVKELEPFALDVKIVEGDDSRADYRVIMAINGIEYRVRRDYRGYVTVSRLPYTYYSHQEVSSSRYHEISEKHYTGITNMKVITAKQLEKYVTAEDAIYKEVLELEAQSKAKKQEFLDSIKGFDVRFWGTNKEEGEIVKNGIRLKFTLEANGYIYKRIEIDSSVDNNLESFKALSNNKYN